MVAVCKDPSSTAAMLIAATIWNKIQMGDMGVNAHCPAARQVSKKIFYIFFCEKRNFFSAKEEPVRNFVCEAVHGLTKHAVHTENTVSYGINDIYRADIFTKSCPQRNHKLA
jgi:hypothetical protein